MIKNSHSTPKITVAHFLPWTGIGGVEIATLRIIRATSNRFKHVVYCLNDARDVCNMFEQAGIESVSYSAPMPSLRHGFRYINDSRRIASSLRERGVEIVAFADVKGAFHCSLAALIAGARQLCHIRVSIPELNLHHRLSLIPVNSYIFVSKEAMDGFALRVPPSGARVVYDAVDIPDGEHANSAVRAQLGVLDSAPVVGMVARVSRQKDYFTLADAAAKVLQGFPEARFLIVGDNSSVDLNRTHFVEVIERLEQLGIDSNFIFTGHRDDVQSLISAMDIVVLCTHREGLPLSIIEAMALGKPVVATAVGGIPEIVIPDVSGFLHGHQNSEELSAAIIKLISDPEATRRLGKLAREHVRANFSVEQFAKGMEHAYLSVVQRS